MMVEILAGEHRGRIGKLIAANPLMAEIGLLRGDIIADDEYVSVFVVNGQWEPIQIVGGKAITLTPQAKSKAQQRQPGHP
jgi:hypothetical protein